MVPAIAAGEYPRAASYAPISIATIGADLRDYDSLRTSRFVEAAERRGEPADRR